jgi:hypothetical protein
MSHEHTPSPVPRWNFRGATAGKSAESDSSPRD